MIIPLPDVLTPAQVQTMTQRLRQDARWVDGRQSVGALGGRVKRNRQVADDCPVRRTIGREIVAALRRQAIFHAVALPRRILPPRINRHAGGEYYGDHVDGAVLQTATDPFDARPLRSDLSCTVFLGDPDHYEGGELVIDSEAGEQAIKLAAGSAVLYPADRIHRVAAVERGERLAAFFWIESLVPDAAERRLLIEIDALVQGLMQDQQQHETAVALTGIYHNLLRRWTR